MRMPWVVMVVAAQFVSAQVTDSPPPESELPVDMDGDGISTRGERIAFALWLLGGGDKIQAVKSAGLKKGANGAVLDLSRFFAAEEVESSSPSSPPVQALAADCVTPVVDTTATVLNTGAIAGQAAIKGFKLFKGTAEPPGNPLDWTQFSYNETAAWMSVTATPIGFPAQPFNLGDMQNNYTCFYVRIRFRLNDLPTVNFDFFSSLEIDLGVDDGFIAYIDGQEIRRFNAPGAFDNGIFLPRTTVATAENSSTDRVSAYANLYASTSPGAEPVIDAAFESVLAIQVFNRTIGNVDCILSPKITARKRGPFVGRSTINSFINPAAEVPTAFEVIIRAAPGLESTLRVDYFVNGDVGTLKSSNRVVVDNNVEGLQEQFRDMTMYRIQIPGMNGQIANPLIPPGTNVTYSVFSGQSRFENDDLTYRTPDPFGTAFTVIAFGNGGVTGQAQSDIANAMKSACANLYIGCGDQVIRNNKYSGNPVQFSIADVEPGLDVQAIDHRFYNLHSQLMSSKLMYTASGDEDLETRTVLPGLSDYDESVVMPENSSSEPGGATEKFYSFDYGNAHFTVLNSAQIQLPLFQTDNGPGSLFLQNGAEQIQFLIDDVTNSNRFWKIVVLHHSPYTTQTTDLDADTVEDDVEFRNELESQVNAATGGGLETLGIDLVLSAHEKFFELSKPLSCCDGMGKPIFVSQVSEPNWSNPGMPVYIVTGGAGEPLYQGGSQANCFPTGEPPTGLGAGATKLWMARCKNFHFTKLTFDKNVLTIQPVNSSGANLDIDPNGAGTSASITKALPNFRRGDTNQDGAINLSDSSFILAALFQGGPQPHCPDTADTNDDGSIQLTDAVYLLNHLFMGGTAPPPPYPGCGQDPTADPIPQCVEYATSC